MPYLGNIPANEFSELLYQDLTGGSGTSFTLTAPVGSPQEIEVFVNNVRQEPGVAYTVSGTTLTMTGSIIASDDFYVVFQGKSVGAATHPASQALQATTGTFTGDLTVDTDTFHVDSTNNNVGVGTLTPTNFGGTTLQTNHASTYTANLVSSGTHVLQMIASQTHGAMSMGARSNHHVAFTTNDTERARFDTSGRFIVGKTGSAIADRGTVITDDGRVDVTPTTTNGSGQVDAIRLHNSGTTAGDGAGIKFSAGTSTTGAGIFAIGQALNSANLIFRAGGDTERMRIESNGNVRINNTSNATFSAFLNILKTAGTNATIHSRVPGTGASSHIIFGSDTSAAVGSIDTNGSATSYNTSSDYRLKENVADMTGAIDRVKALTPKRFNFIANADTTVDGFLAHEAQAVVPEAVTGTKDEVDDDGNAVMQGIDQAKLVPLLTGALQEAIAKIEALEAKVAKLEGGE